MKLSLSLLTLFACALSMTACNTLENRRSLYSPKKGDGYWTHTLNDGKWRTRGEGTVETTVRRGSPPPEPGRNVPPPPPPPPAEPKPPVTEPNVPLPDAPPPAL